MHLVRSLGFVFLAAMLLSALPSCVNTKKTVYFDNVQDTIIPNIDNIPEAKIQKNDLLSINVSSLNPEASVIFNTPNLVTAMTATTSGSTGSPGSTGAPQFTGYLVATDGTIKFPVLGALAVAGKSKRAVEDEITATLLEKKLLVDPIVSVRFLNFRITILGEVARPTTINVVNEKITLLEALGLAGDLTIFGKRDNVLLIRDEGGQRIIKRINLNARESLTSQYYYLKTNDVVYVEPNSAKIAATSRTQQLLPIILSGMSFIAIIASYYIRK